VTLRGAAASPQDRLENGVKVAPSLERLLDENLCSGGDNVQAGETE